MATYKIIQDIEAEDHILGPLTLKQFIFALGAVFCFYISFLLFTKHIYPFIILFLLPGLFCAFFAFPFGRDQPTEIWALAKLHYFFKPRKRIWDQSGIKELVTVNVPKKIEVDRTNGLSQTEVKSRLKVLASTIDSRGWAIKNVGPNAFSNPAVIAGDSDRLIDLSSVPQPVQPEEVNTVNDMLDPLTSPLAQQFDNLISQSTSQKHQQLVKMVNSPVNDMPLNSADSSNWFMGSVPRRPTMDAPPQISGPEYIEHVPEPTFEEETSMKDIISKHKEQSSSLAHLRTLKPISPAQTPAAPGASDAAHYTAILNLSRGNDFNVSTLAHEINKDAGDDDNEVVVSLH